MKSLKNICAFLFIGLFMISSFMYFAGSSTSGTGWAYLKNSQGYTIDTIGSASANDTSYTFINPNLRNPVVLEYKQNSIISSVTINYPTAPNQIRLRYLAADSSFYVEQNNLLGWTGTSVFSQTSLTPVAKFTASLKTGNALLSLRGVSQ